MSLQGSLGSAQAVLDVANASSSHKSKPHPPPLFVAHTLYLLPLLVLSSAFILFASYIGPRVYRFCKSCASRRQPIFLDDDDLEEPEVEPAPAPPPLPSQGLWYDFSAHIRNLRAHGTAIVLLDLARTAILIALLGLSIYAAIQAEAPEASKGSSGAGGLLEALKKKKKKKHRSKPGWYSDLELGEFGACFFYLYNLLFSFLLLTLRHTRLRRRLTAHVDLMLFCAFGIFAYRDIWPKLTFYLAPSDIDNWVTWTRVGLLGVAGMLIPSLRPRTYIPVDPLNPTPVDQIHPEQTAPFLFFIFYEFMTGLVWRAWHTTSLPYDELHPLADYDRAEHLYYQHVENMDPVKRRQRGLKPRHLFWAIIYEFRWEFFVTSVMCVISATAEILPTVAMKQLLEYMQSEGNGALIRPFVWISLLFIGPTVGSLSINYYVYIMTRCLVRGEAMLTQLLFDHALRLRMKDSVGEDEKAAEGVPEITVEDTEQDGEQTDSVTEVGSKDAKGKDEKHAPPKPGQGLAGRINVLMAQDIESVVEGRDIPLLIVFTPVQIALCMVVLFRVLSWSSLFGVTMMLLTLPLPGLITKWAAQYQGERMAATDARVDAVTEAVGALRIIKMFGWEERIMKRIAQRRERELELTWKRRVMNLLNVIVNLFLPVLTMAASFASYTLIEKKELTAATVYTSMGVFELLKGLMSMAFYFVNEWVTCGVSLQRLNAFLQESDMIDEYSQGTRATIQTPEEIEAVSNGLIRLKEATFAWGVDTGNKNIMNFRLNVPDVTFEKGKVNIIAGPTGSGKSTFLAALIGELHFEPRPNSFFHLPRDGGVSFAAQESWCTSESVKDNILFGEPYDAARYRKVIHDCALETDLKLFDDGDATEIGEKGLTLSGGQKARVTLARAIYHNSAVILLDDVFSALDTLTSRFILDNLFKGDLIKDRTIVIVTHHIHLVAPVASYMVMLNESGAVASAGPIDHAMISTASSMVDLKASEETSAPPPDAEAPATEEAEPAAKKANKLIKDEEKSEGRISKRAMISFFSTFGGPLFWAMYFGLLTSGLAVTAFQTYWLGLWAQAYNEAEDPAQVSAVYWLGLYLVWVTIGVIGVAVSSIVYYLGAMRASRAIHAKLVSCIFGAYMRFLDSTPVGRIIGRFTKDMKTIDGNFTETANGLFDITLNLIIKFITVVFLVPFFSVPAVIIGVIGAFIGEVYIHGQLSVKREMSNAKSPLFSHLSAAVSGIVSIRAYAAQDQIRTQARTKADKYTRAATAFYNLNRWVTVRIDMLGGVFAACLAAFLVYVSPLNPTKAGFALTQAISFSMMILWWVRMINELEVQGNSIERIEDYLVIDQEPKSVESRKPPASWPTSGEILLKDLSARYSEDGPTVLDHLNLTIKSGEKIGIVGRTGSGKSTLTLALLRMIPTTGQVYISGVRTDQINLNDLRSAVTIIPQDPILLSGTLRFNLDPFDDHDDSTLNDALEQSGLGNVRRAASGTATPLRITLDTQIAAGGSNLSQGQRQLVALARALVRQSKVLILDEATASVDFETDRNIQQSIRNLPDTTTVLTVAHRLATISDYDRILVLGAGKVLEFDTPENLTANKDSYYAKLVEAMEG